METTSTMNQSLGTILKQSLSIEDQVNLGLIRNPIVDPHKQVQQIKQTLSHYSDDLTMDECGISYAGNLLANDEPSNRELEHALDDTRLLTEELTPQTKRNNFRYIDKQRNNHDGYTRYILANGGERIITDDELNTNPYLEYQRTLSDAFEEGDRETYNKVKEKRQATQSKKRNATNTKPDEIEQCFVQVNGKLYGDMFQMYHSRFNQLDTIQMNTTNHQLLQTLDNNEHPILDLSYVIIRLLKDNPEFKYIYEHKQKQTEIKIVNINNKLLAKIK